MISCVDIENYLSEIYDVPLYAVNTLTLPVISIPPDADQTWHFKHNPQYHLAGAQSAIVFLFPYQLVKTATIREQGAIASIGYHPDYHLTIAGYLQRVARRIVQVHSGVNYKLFVDKHGLADVKMAQLAGLGFIGKNALLIDPHLGSAVNIGYILLDCAVEPFIKWTSFEQCGNCQRCEVACPTGALHDYSCDQTRCRSALNQKKGVLTASEVRAVGNWFYGCDICQYVCPFNNVKTISDSYVDLSQILLLTKSTFKEKHVAKSYGYLGLARLKRNAMIVLFNQKGIVALTPYLEQIMRSQLLSDQYTVLKNIENA